MSYIANIITPKMSYITAFVVWGIVIAIALFPLSLAAQHHNLPACRPNHITLTRKNPAIAVEIPARYRMGENRCDYDAMMWLGEFKGPDSVVMMSCLFPQTKETVQSFWEGKKHSHWVMFFPPEADVVCTASLLGGPGPVVMTVVGTRFRRTESRDEIDL